MEWFIAEWPDGFWCDWSERLEFSHRSDDFFRSRVFAWDESYCPTETALAPLVVFVSTLGVARFVL